MDKELEKLMDKKFLTKEDIMYAQFLLVKEQYKLLKELEIFLREKRML